MTEQSTLELLRELVVEQRWDDVDARLRETDPADVAELITDLPAGDRLPLFAHLTPECQAEVVPELESSYLEPLLEGLSDDQIADLAEIMSPDDSADLLSDLDAEQSARVLAAMEPEERQTVSGLLHYAEDTAGHVMTTEVLVLPATATVGDARRHLAVTEFSDPVLYIFVLDPESEALIGLVTLTDVFGAHVNTRLGDIADRDFVSASPEEDQEAVARKFRKYDTWVMPVLDESGRLLGRITADDILEVIQDEADEDLALRVGAPDIEDQDESPVRVAGRRLPWLLITMFAGLVNSVIIKQMLNVTNVVAIAVFVPVILAMGGNTGMQSSTVSVRGLALGEQRFRKLRQIVGREVLVGACLGMVCGVLTAVVVVSALSMADADTGQLTPAALGLTVGLSMANAMIFASSFGAVAPIILDRLGADPALAAGPFITTFNDLSASVIYFLTCLVLLSLA